MGSNTIKTLSEIMKDHMHPLSYPEKLAVALQCCQIIQEHHDTGYIHDTIQAENFTVERSGESIRVYGEFISLEKVPEEAMQTLEGFEYDIFDLGMIFEHLKLPTKIYRAMILADMPNRTLLSTVIEQLLEEAQLQLPSKELEKTMLKTKAFLLSHPLIKKQLNEQEAIQSELDALKSILLDTINMSVAVFVGGIYLKPHERFFMVDFTSQSQKKAMRSVPWAHFSAVKKSLDECNLQVADKIDYQTLEVEQPPFYRLMIPVDHARKIMRSSSFIESFKNAYAKNGKKILEEVLKRDSELKKQRMEKNQQAYPELKKKIFALVQQKNVNPTEIEPIIQDVDETLLMDLCSDVLKDMEKLVGFSSEDLDLSLVNIFQIFSKVIPATKLMKHMLLRVADSPALADKLR